MGDSCAVAIQNFHLATNRQDEADELVRRFHYSHRTPGSVQICLTLHEDGGLFGDSGPAVAAVYYSSPPTRWSESVWELSRLVRTDDCPVSLSGLISYSVRWIRQNKLQNLLVSFADATQGHHGGVYQAASWNYHGQRDRAMDGLMINGKFVPGRTCNANWGTRSPERLAERIQADIQPHYDDGKHLYWKATDKRGEAKAIILGLAKNAYPKPDKGESK